MFLGWGIRPKSMCHRHDVIAYAAYASLGLPSWEMYSISGHTHTCSEFLESLSLSLSLSLKTTRSYWVFASGGLSMS